MQAAGAGSHVNPHYHSHGDTWSTLNPVYYANVTRAVAGLLYDLSVSLTTTGIPAGVPGPVPESFALSQNYPNPFNPVTTIRYELPEPSHVTLTVFNTLGQQVAKLVDADIEAGFHDVQFDAGALATGAYFYRLQAGGFVETKRLMVLK